MTLIKRDAGAAAGTHTPVESARDVDFAWGVKIPMRDGARLNATLYKPKGPAPVPAIFTLTPYIADTYHPRAAYFAQHSYAFALVDCRGRGNSEGEFEPFANEARDGHDVVQWLARQAWCDGQVSMWGGSYAGFDQWMTLKEFPKALKTIVPAAAPFAGVDFPFLKNIFFSYEMRWMTDTSGVSGNDNLFDDAEFWIRKFQEMYQNHRPYRELDQIVGNTSTFFQAWVSHPQPEAYWDRMTPTPAQFDKINVPILTITGCYDGDQPGAMEYYRRHMRSKSRAKDRHCLVIGPWDHAGTRTPCAEFGGMKFGEASLVDLDQLHTQWYDWTMKKGKRPQFLKKRVAYYVMGAEKWKYAEALEATTRRTLPWYLNSSGEASDVFHSGTLEPRPPHGSAPDAYTYDPLDTRPGELEREEIKDFITDQTYDLNLFGNGLVYHSAPLARETEITGWAKLRLWLSLDVPDTDFSVTLSEVLTGGKVILLTQDQLRARYRESLREDKLVVPDEISPYVFDGFTFFSRRLAKGSRLRLVITCPNSIYYQKNYNGGGVVAGESSRDARTAHITVYHDADHLSCLELPQGR